MCFIAFLSKRFLNFSCGIACLYSLTHSPPVCINERKTKISEKKTKAVRIENKTKNERIEKKKKIE